MKKKNLLVLISLFLLMGCKQMPNYNDDSYSYIDPESLESEQKEEITFDFSSSGDFSIIFNKINNSEEISLQEIKDNLFASDYKYSKVNEETISSELFYEEVDSNIVYKDGDFIYKTTINSSRNNEDYSLNKEVNKETADYVKDGSNNIIKNNANEKYNEAISLNKEEETVTHEYTYENDETKNKTETSDFIYSSYYQELNLLNSSDLFLEFVSEYEKLSGTNIENDLNSNTFSVTKTSIDDKAEIKFSYTKKQEGFQEKSIYIHINFAVEFLETDISSISYKYTENNSETDENNNPFVLKSVYREIVD